ncbi:hypothetical protein HHI36_001659, partial [Cryptolaemus montrouzieri]
EKYEDSELKKQRLETRIDKLEKKRNTLINSLEVTVTEEEFEELKLEQEKVKSLIKDLRTQQSSLVNAIKLKQGSDRPNPATFPLQQKKLVNIQRKRVRQRKLKGKHTRKKAFKNRKFDEYQSNEVYERK